MSKKTRYFVLVAVAFLAIGLTTGLVASYMGLSVPVFSRAAGPEELQYVRADSALVAYANVNEVMKSDFRQRFRKLEPDTKERDEFEQKTGINIDDIQSVVAAMSPRGDGSAKLEESLVVIARVRYEQDRLERLALEHGGQVAEYRGKRLLTHSDKRTGGQEVAVGFLDSDLVAVGSYTGVTGAIEAKTTGANVVSNAAVMKQINELENNNSNLWAVGRFDALTNHARIPNEFAARLPQIQSFRAAGRINGGVRGVFTAETRDEETAKNLGDVLQGFLALARMQTSGKPEFKTMVDSLKLQSDGKVVSIGFEVPSEVFDVFQEMHKKRSGNADDAPKHDHPERK